MIWVDYIILATIAISALVSLMRGFVREAISLAGWILAFWLALSFMDEVAALIAGQISVPSLRLGLAFFVLFIVTLLLTAVVNYFAGLLVSKTGLSGTDRVLGMVFGAARGALIVALLVLLAGLTALPRDRWWQQSVLIVHFQALALEVRSFLPAEIAGYFNFQP